MSQAAEAHDSWADQPDPVPPRRGRREPESWASAEDLEMLSGIGQPRSMRSADWTVLTLERDDEDGFSTVLPEEDDVEPSAARPRRGRITGRPSLTVVEDERAAVAELQAAREAAAAGGCQRPPHRGHPRAR